GQHDDAAAAALPPRLEGLALVRARVAADLHRPGRRLVVAGLVGVRPALLADVLHDGPVAAALGAVAAGALVEAAAGPAGGPLRVAAGGDDGAAVERQADRCGAHDCVLCRIRPILPRREESGGRAREDATEAVAMIEGLFRWGLAGARLRPARVLPSALPAGPAPGLPAPAASGSGCLPSVAVWPATSPGPRARS